MSDCITDKNPNAFKPSDSFTYYHCGDDLNKLQNLIDQNSVDLISKSPVNELMQSSGLHLEDNYFDGKKNEQSVEQSVKNRALVHTVSSYRKQQQKLRVGDTLSYKVLSTVVHTLIICTDLS